MNEDFSEIIAAVKKFAVDNLSLSTLSDEELEEQIKTITDNMIGNRYVSIKNRVDIAQQVFSSIRGFGLLDTIMNDDTITEVMINGADNIFIEQAGRVKRLDESFESQRKLEDIIQRIVGKAGREVNQSNPIVDTRLPDGSRVNVVLPPIALCGPTVTIRKFSKTPMTIEKLISYGSITREIADKLKLLVEAKYNIFICGGTGSGKTTFLNALSNYIPKDERVITIEDSAELQIKGVDNLVSLETRNANASGAGAVTIRDLIKSSLRMRPERIVVGEVRGGEALDMLQAMNTGHDGSLSTGHANSTIEQTKNSITDQVINATVTPFLNSVKGIVGKIDSNWGEEKIKEELNASLEKLKENSTDDIFGKCKTLAIEYLQGKVDKVTSTIYQNLSSTTENMANETMKQVKGLFYSENSTPGYIEELTEQLKAKVNELSSKLQENVTNALNSTEDNVKEKLNSALTDFTDKVSGTVSSGLDKVGEAAPDNNTVGDVTNAKAATISLNYKEYLYAFMLIGILANEDNMIARTGYLMQMNISQKMTDAGFDDSDRENFDMTKMYTMVQIHSEADVDSVFMGMFEKKTVNGEESYSLNFDGDGSSTDRLVYNGFIGY